MKVFRTSIHADADIHQKIYLTFEPFLHPFIISLLTFNSCGWLNSDLLLRTLPIYYIHYQYNTSIFPATFTVISTTNFDSDLVKRSFIIEFQRAILLIVIFCFVTWKRKHEWKSVSFEIVCYVIGRLNNCTQFDFIFDIDLCHQKTKA